MINRHYNKIVKMITPVLDIKKRLEIIDNYCLRFNKSSSTHHLSFYENILYHSVHYDGYGYAKNSQTIDMKEFLDLSVIRDEKINSILK